MTVVIEFALGYILGRAVLGLVGYVYRLVAQWLLIRARNKGWHEAVRLKMWLEPEVRS